MKHIFIQLILLISVLLLLLIIIKYYNKKYESFESPTWAIVQYDDRPLSDTDKKLIDINQQYAARHNYDYFFLNNGYEHLPPYWAKVAAVHDLLKQGKHKGVCWIDTDAVFVKPSTSIDDFCNIDPTKSFYMAQDPPVHHNGNFNAGIWFVRNDTNGNSIMDHWMNCWNAVAKDWTKNGPKWHCTGTWSGPSYEQGAFIDNVFKHNELSKFIKQFSYDFLQSIDASLPNAFTLHFSSHQKAHIPSFLESYKLL